MGRTDTSSCLICALVVALASMLGADRLRAQESVRDSASGPPLQTSIPTIRSYVPSAATGPGIRVRYDAFERDFARDFGLGAIMLDSPGGPPGFFERLHDRLATKYGDTSIYGWVERCVALYAQIQGLTRTEHAGFDMSLEVDDMTEGRVGLQMSRSLD